MLHSDKTDFKVRKIIRDKGECYRVINHQETLAVQIRGYWVVNRMMGVVTVKNTKEELIIKGHKETFMDDGRVHSLDCGEGSMGM